MGVRHVGHIPSVRYASILARHSACTWPTLPLQTQGIRVTHPSSSEHITQHALMCPRRTGDASGNIRVFGIIYNCYSSAYTPHGARCQVSRARRSSSLSRHPWRRRPSRGTACAKRSKGKEALRRHSPGVSVLAASRVFLFVTGRAYTGRGMRRVARVM